MGKGEAKRLKIFNRYSEQLGNIIKLGLYDRELPFEKTYLCPICLIPFSEESLDISKELFLTLEDAPPKSLGGKSNTLTCKKCNNESGHKIDFHLLENLKELEIHSFSPNTDSRVFLTHQGVKVQGILKIDENGLITVLIKKEINDPTIFSEYVAMTGKDDFVNLKFPATRVELKKFDAALLKAAYILAFEKFGYSLILSDAYNPVREQIKNPNKDIYPSGFWSTQKVFNETNAGVHLIVTPEFEGFQAIFVLKTNSNSYGYAVYLPTSEKETQKVIEKLKIQQAGFRLAYNSFKNSDYFGNEENQKLMAIFMKKRNKN